MKDWNQYREELLGRVGEFAKLNPPAMKGIAQLDSASQHGALDAKTHEFIAIAVAITTRCEGCISVHVKKAKELGATKEEIAEVLGTAIALNTGAALTYSAHALDAFDNL